MIYPVGTKETFDKLWYIASGFGERRSSTWYHSGSDFNLKTGGNSDFNQDLFAVADGEILTTRYRKTGFGNVLTMKFDVNGKTFYALYAHLNGFNCKPGDMVKQGERICRLGNSGNSEYAHLHFSIKNTANGIDNIPNNEVELNQWEDPMVFIKKHYGVSSTQDSMPTNNDLQDLLDKYKVKDLSELDEKINLHVGTDWGGGRDSGYLGGEREKTKNLQADLKTCQETKKVIADELQSVKDNSEKYINGLVYLLNPNPTQYKDVSKPDMVEIEIKNLIDKEAMYDKKERELQKAVDDAKQAKNEEILSLKADIASLKEKLENVSQRVDDVEQDVEQEVITTKDISPIKKFFNKLLTMWRKS